MVEIAVQVKDQALVSVRRDQIIEAARRVFREKGYHEATVRDIGRAAGLTQGTLYNYVRAKQDILFLLCQRLANSYRAAVEEAIAREQEPERRLCAAVRAVVRTMAASQDDLILLYQETHALERSAMQDILKTVREDVDVFMGVLKDATEAGVIAPANLQLTANIMTFLPAVAALRRWDLNRHCTAEEIEDGLFDFIMRGLGRESRL